jgi:solute carrier family 25 S-adenosylmethionine transporter 26
MLDALRRVYAENGLRSLFAGVVPRMTWISVGGAVFFGVYEKAKRVIANVA